MKTQYFSKRTFLTLMIIIIFASEIYFTKHISSSITLMSNQQGIKTLPLRVDNKTSSFDVIEVKRSRNRAILTFQNNYGETITAFSVAVGKGHINSELIDTDRIIAPGSTIVKEYKLYSEATTVGNEIPEIIITILAVVFDNKGGDGDKKIIKEILDTRKGDRIQINRILPILQEVLDQPDSNLSAALNAAKLKIISLPETEADNISSPVTASLKDTKQIILHRLKELERIQSERGDAELRKTLNELKERYKKISMRREAVPVKPSTKK